MKKDVSPPSLKNSILYKYILPEWEPVIEAGKERRFFKKGAVIFREGDAVKGIFFLETGKVKIHQHWGREKELIIGFAKPGDMIGYRGLGKDKLQHSSATALEPTEVAFITTRLLETTITLNPRLSYALINFYANELQLTETRMRNMALMEVKGRIAENLLLLSHQFGINTKGFINITLTKQDLAAYTGTTYETLSRTLQELKAGKLIKTEGKYIGILKEKELFYIAHPYHK
ncbi:transcriptional regulator [Niabella ginsenosidivorans]|uniref:Transcriptional regulator n=1 Tax=Niabella ginsenosidivorans TaxID=1176587 RepID=A0A1A9I407_9BACT|nr:Crp/Fnr family transcriptional regulator [Niabella ginsenosidivorans]ANH81304.1 transcriptional regulator [Niabella ginsenosidivorans]